MKKGKWQYFHFETKSFSPSFPLLLCSSTPSSPSILKLRPPLLAVCKSSHFKLLFWAPSWPPIGGEADEFPRNRWCLDRLQKSKSTSSLGWEDCIDERPPPSQKLLLLGNLNGTNVSRDENENFFLSISCFETRTRISFFNVVFRDENREIENHF